MATDPDPPLLAANLRAARYYIAHTGADCPHCGATTQLTALALSPGHETRDDDAEDWQQVEANAFFFHVAAVSPAVYRRLLRDTPNFRFLASESGESYWANHCEQCGLVIGDDELHGEPGAHGFVLCSEAHAAQVALVEIYEPFEALVAGCSLEPEFFAFMRRA